MSERRSRSRSGGTGERGPRAGRGQARPEGQGGQSGPQARPHSPSPIDPASPPPPPALRRSQRKSGSAPPEAPPQPPPPTPRTAITLKKIVAPATEASPARAQRSVTVRKVASRTPETPTSRDHKSAAKKKVSPRPEVTLLEKENSPPLQGSIPFNKGSCPLTAAPALEVTTPVLGPLTPNAIPRPELMDARDLEMSRKVRRSYSRLDDIGSGSGSTSTPNYRRHSFFGFERLLSGEELENVSPVVKESKSQAVAPTAEPWGRDSSLPGITKTKEKRRKRRVVPEILKSELDEWAAAMNAQFEAAEKFDLLVE